MQRNTLVTLMLVIAAALLAIGLFAAGSICREAEFPQSPLPRARCSDLLFGKRVPHRQRGICTVYIEQEKAEARVRQERAGTVRLAS